MNYTDEKILILDFGSQFTQLIARRIREANIYCEIHPFSIGLEQIREFSPKGIIFSGGPNSVYDDGAPTLDKAIFDIGVPILGICYGMQLISHLLGGSVKSCEKREYGFTTIDLACESVLFKSFDKKDDHTVWMSHGDSIEQAPEGFEVVASSKSTKYAAMQNKARNIYAIQFHPEVEHTQNGFVIIKNFLFEICGCEGRWNMASFIDYQVEHIKKIVGDKNVILGLSGGVDSSVAAVLIHKAIGDQLKCIFVNNGLLRKNEADKVVATFKDNFHINLIYVDATDRFLDKLAGIEDPEQKRKIIGYEFIEVFDDEAKHIDNVGFLGQGTLYPDVIESVAVHGSSVVIKSHHNVGGLPEKMNLKLLEPFRELFKDEVRRIGLELGISDDIIYRQPFPGPGLSVRILGDVTRERIAVLQDADEIVVEEIKNAGLYRDIWQAFAVLLPVKSVGVMGDSRTYENVCAIRAVESSDAMTADWAKIPYNVLAKMSSRIINEVKGINRVVYDISSKPPATIEWE